MSSSIRISLRAGERLFVNGAVMRTDRKVSLEFLNNVTFMLENHVLQPEEACTPLRQLYYIAQMKLIEPSQAEATDTLLEQSYRDLIDVFENEKIQTALRFSRAQMMRGKMFDALRTIRRLFPLEDEIRNLAHATKIHTHAPKKELA